MNIQAYQLHTHVRKEHNLTQHELFYETSKEKRDVIINRIFVRYANHSLHHKRGLYNVKKPRDRFDNYTSYDHLNSFEELAFDLNYTIQQSKDKLARIKRQNHLKRKERFEKRKYQTIAEITSKAYKQKWEPKNKKTQERLKRLSTLKENEQDKSYER